MASIVHYLVKCRFSVPCAVCNERVINVCSRRTSTSRLHFIWWLPLFVRAKSNRKGWNWFIYLFSFALCWPRINESIMCVRHNTLTGATAIGAQFLLAFTYSYFRIAIKTHGRISQRIERFLEVASELRQPTIMRRWWIAMKTIFLVGVFFTFTA